MSLKRFQALVVRETEKNRFEREITSRSTDDLPAGDVLIKVAYSSLNYKDALSASGNRGVTRRYPHTPGTDAAGTVEESTQLDFKIGDPVIVTGYDLGMNTAGGFGGYIRVPAEWVVRLPPTLSLREAMIYGTAGFTAALSVYRLILHGITPDQGEILVTGASGGVGSLALSMLAKLGYNVVAASGKKEAAQFLLELGARRIIGREEISDTSKKALLDRRWAGVVDTVGGQILSTAIRSTDYQGAVTCCGNVAGADLDITVYPFILRGVALLGVDSAATPMSLRTQIWDNLAGPWKPDHLERLANEIPLSDINRHIDLILQGKLKGRTILNLQSAA